LIEWELARLMGCEAAVLAPSTLHLFTDLFGHVKPGGTAIYVDRGSYAIARWCLDRASVRGIPLSFFRHFDPSDLLRSLDSPIRRGLRPLVLTDGLCMESGRVAPLDRYLNILRPRNGWLVVDDTQALGLLGGRPAEHGPYGRGGGGSLRWHGITGERVVTVSSLAKSFGVPIAVLGSDRATVGAFRKFDGTRMHCSPPVVPTLLAARQALRQNRLWGETRRLRLAALVARLRLGLDRLGLAATGGPFPVQGIRGLAPLSVVSVQCRLRDAGILTLLRQPHPQAPPELTIAVTAGLDPSDIDRLLDALARAVRQALATSNPRPGGRP
jgi:8-amino-7-oxononanoate synthase